MLNRRFWRTRSAHIVALLLTVSSVFGTVFVTSAEATLPPRYAVIDLHPHGSSRSIAFAINNRGEVVGNEGPHSNFGLLPGPPIGDRAFLYRNGSITLLDLLGGNDNWVWGISDTGMMAGAVESRTGRQFPHAALFDDDSALNLGTLGGDMSLAFDVNANGQVVGWAENAQIKNRAFLYDNGVMHNLGTLGGDSSEAYGINAAGQVVGNSRTGPTPTGPQHAFLYSEGVMTDLHTISSFFDGSGSSEAWDINDNGQVVGACWRPVRVGDDIVRVRPDAFLYGNGLVTGLGTLGGDSSIPRAINSRGQVVGNSLNSAGRNHAFLYDAESMTDLNSLIDPSLGWELLYATDVNDKGQIVGYGLIGEEGHAFLLTPVPEPATIVFISFGLLLHMMLARFRVTR